MLGEPTHHFEYGDLCRDPDGHLLYFAGVVEDGTWPVTEGWAYEADEMYEPDSEVLRVDLDDLKPLDPEFWSSGAGI